MTKTPNRPFAVRAALAMLGLLLLALALPAVAMTFSAPTGSLPTNIPFVVQWLSTPGPGKVDISISSSTQSTFLATGHLNSGQASFSFPATLVCNHQEEFRIRVARYTLHPNESQYIQWHDSGYSAPFTFTCPITVTKQVINTTGRPASGRFRMRVQCEPGSQTFADIAASGQGSFTRKVHVAPGSSVCTVQEVGMPMAPIGCNWLTTYPGGQQRQPGGPPVIVVNTLQCGATTPPDRRP